MKIVGEGDEGFVLCGVTIFDAPQMRSHVVGSTIDHRNELCHRSDLQN